jgi:hypothetical protein
VSSSKAQVLASIVAIGLSVGAASGQHAFQNTVTVDPSGNADQTTIQAAINSIGAVTVRTTVLIYSATYAENVTLGTADENIDLVGIDRDGVIIAPSSGNGITITSGTETSRSNGIRNLTIVTTSGHGIEVVKGGTPAPKDLVFRDVTIDASGSSKAGITGVDAEVVSVLGCDIATDDGDGIVTGDEWTLRDVTVLTADSGTSDATGVNLGSHDDIAMENCRITGERRALWIDECEDVVVKGCTLATPGSGAASIGCVTIQGGTARVTFQDCSITSDATGTSRVTPIAVFLDDEGTTSVEDIVFQWCRISAVGGSSSTAATGLRHDLDGEIQLIDCDISAVNVKTTTPAQAIGLTGPIARMFGGVVTTSSSAEKETDVWDIQGIATGETRTSGTRYSKWKGPIASAERQRSVVQRTIDVAVIDDDGIRVAVDLTSTEQSITTLLNDPDVYRVLSVTGNESDMDQDVFIIGTDWAGNAITDKITLSGTTTVAGVKPFKTVTKLIVPAEKDADETVKVGTTLELGLYFPIAATADVLQQGFKATAANSYTLESVGTVDVTYSTLTVDTFIGTPSFEWVLLASQ